ncbi:MAG: hypothetical protein ACP5OA_00720 [Candidatus Woesearchaeota archaeon]
MNKVIKFLDELSDEELYEFEKDMKSGIVNKFVEQKKEYFKVKDKLCSSCGNNVGEDCIVVIYGDPRISLRRKAHFCGTDCMEYFINRNIKKSKNKSYKKEINDKVIKTA